MSASPPLKQLGRYQLTRVLGKGAMGVVYEGLDPRLNRTVAVKTILKSQILDADTAADYSARFVREAQAVARLNHPNIVTVFDFGEENEVAYIVMEYIRGRELKDYFDENQFFDVREALRIMCELLDALEFAHQQGIVHRDIKPANLMLDANGRVKLTDFGVARMADTGHDRTIAGTMVGTPSYMSPEQIQGIAVGPRTDIFAAGVVLYQFLTHEKPFTGQGQWTIQKKIVQEDPKPPSFVNSSVPPVFDAIIGRALAKSADDRYPSAAAFAAELRRVLALMPPEDDDATRIAPAARPAPVSAPAATPPAPAPRPAAPALDAAPPHWAQETVALQEPVTPQAETPRARAPDKAPPAPPPPRPAAPQEPAAPPPAKKSAVPLMAGAALLVIAAAGGGWYFLRTSAPPPAAVPAVPAPPATVGPAPAQPAAPALTDPEAIRQQRLEEELKRREDEVRRQAEEAERNRKAEAEQRRAAEEERRVAEESRRKAEEETRARVQDDAKRKADEAARRKADLEAQRRADEEAARAKAQQEAARKAEEEAQRKAEAETRRKAEEEAARRRAEEDARRKAAAEEDARRKAQEQAKAKAEEEKARLSPAELVAQASRLEADGKVSAAVKLYRQAANAGNGEAAKKLGEIYGKGSGDVGRDYAESVKWYGIAKDRGMDVPTPGRR